MSRGTGEPARNAVQSRNSSGADADAARVRALAAYKDFLTLWKDADADIPVLKQAKAEYAKRCNEPNYFKGRQITRAAARILR